MKLSPVGVFAAGDLYLDGFLVQMGSDALFATVKFVVALPDHPAVLAVGMPHLRAVPASAAAAFYFAGEDAHSALPPVVSSVFSS